MAGARSSTRKAPLQEWLGLAFLAVFWPLNWLLPDSTHRTSYLFFPLWFGYILVVDGLVLRRSGTSQLARSPRDFLLQFLASAPAWWLFEVINWRTRNWEYLGGQSFTGFEYVLLSSISFSTVMPAVFETAELVRTLPGLGRFARGPHLLPKRQLVLALLGVGALTLTAILLWPRQFYPLVWGAVFFILEPLNRLLGRRTTFDWLEKGDWRPIVSLSAGALVCGFFWEMWNYLSYPKWTYHTPGAEFFHVFEMPLLGYLGYPPFAWELYALRNFLWPKAPALRI
jgi:hypothetical protein